jgi:hypothetical protein
MYLYRLTSNITVHWLWSQSTVLCTHPSPIVDLTSCSAAEYCAGMHHDRHDHRRRRPMHPSTRLMMRLVAAAGSSSFLFAAVLVAFVRLSAATQRPRMGRRHQCGCRRVDGAAIGGRGGLARTCTDARRAPEMDWTYCGPTRKPEGNRLTKSQPRTGHTRTNHETNTRL